MKLILVINPGSTSTKVALFKKTENVIQNNLTHSAEEIAKFERVSDQLEMRQALIEDWMKEEGYQLSDLEAVVGRGGLLRSMPGGTYEVTSKMKEDLIAAHRGEHASNLGGLIADKIAEKAGVKSYIVDPVAVDEFEDIARISGIPQIERISLGHALNVKAVGRKAAKELGKGLDEVNLIVAHIGGGISICPLRKGKAIDYNNANEMGPFSPERTGGLPCGDLVKLCFSGKYTLAEMKKKISGKGGLVAYLGTNDAREVQKLIDAGDEKAKLIFSAMAYQIAKEIGQMATVLKGEVDAIVMTGGVSYSENLTNQVKEMVSFIAPYMVIPGEDEMLALAEGTVRVLNGEEKAKIYENEVKL